MRQIRRDVERPAGRLRDQLVGRQQARLGVHLAPQPGHQRREVALRQRYEQVRHRRAGGGEELCGRHRAERVGREIAPGADRPVDVLQAAARIARHLEPE